MVVVVMEDPPNKIIQFGPVRSGSTLVYNLLRDIFPNSDVRKTHNIEKNPSTKYIVATYRNPLDTIASIHHIHDQIPTKTTIREKIFFMKNNGLIDFLNIIDNDKILKLKYEDFYNNYNYIYDKFETYFKIKIDSRQRLLLNKKYKINNVKKIVQKYDSFHYFDGITHWHGDHISPRNGAPNSYDKVFNDEQIEFIKKGIGDIIKKLDYNRYNGTYKGT